MTVPPRPPAEGGGRGRELSVRSTLGLLAAVGTATIVVLSLLLALTIMPSALLVRQGVEPVVYLIHTLAAQAEALENAEHDVRGLVAGNGPVERGRLLALRARLVAMTDQTHLRGYDKVPRSLRSALAGTDADITRLEDRLLEALDLVDLGRRDAARQRVLLADSLQITIRRGLVDAQSKGAIDLVSREAELERAARLAMWFAGLLAAAGLALSALYLAVVRRRVDRPLGDLSRALERVRAGDLRTELPVRRHDELGRLAEHFNATTRAMAAVRLRDEEALRRSESSYQALVEQASYGIYRSTTAGRFLMVNPALVAMLGYDSPEELMRLDMTREVYADSMDRSRLIRDHPAQAEVVWKRRDGAHITVQLSARWVSGPDGVEHYEGIAEDVTEQRALEDQLRQAQKMEAVGRLAGGVAHDFNNLLTAMTGFTELLADRLPAGDPKWRHVEGIRTATRRAADLTRQLLAFSRKQVLQPCVLDLNTVVRSLDRMLQRLIGEDVRLEIAAGADLGSVRADQGQIEQVILNLAVNARDAMPDGGRLMIETANVELDAVYVRDHTGSAPGRYVVLAVTDSGVGMDAETQSHIFEPFFTTKPVGQGTGLGLATVYGIVKQSGGHVWVDSEPGRGATFRVYLPRVSDPVPLTPPSPASPPLVRGSGTILLAEDDPRVREVLAEVLRLSGYRVLRAADGQAALELAQAHPGEIQVLVTDVVMPGMTGPELAEALVASRPGIRVLYMSGYTGDAMVRRREMGDGASFLQKPFSPSAIASKVREILDRD